MQTQQSNNLKKQKRVSILSGNLRTIVIILGLIFLVVCAFFWFKGINNDQLNKIMGVVFTIFTGACAFLSVPFFNRSDDGQAPLSTQIPPFQINNNNNIYQFQSNAQQPASSPTQPSTHTNSIASIAPLSTAPTISASNPSNKPITYPSQIGKRNVLDSKFFNEVVQALEGLPATASFQGRNALLIGLPRNIIASLHRDSNSDANDLENILTQLDGLGPLEAGEQPLIIFIQNALRRAEGLEVSESLNTALEELKQRYGLS